MEDNLSYIYSCCGVRSTGTNEKVGTVGTNVDYVDLSGVWTICMIVSSDVHRIKPHGLL